MSLSRQKNHQKLLQGAKRGQSANTDIFPFPKHDSGGMACKSQKKTTLVRFGPCVSAGERRLRAGRKITRSCSREQNEGNLLTLVFFRYQPLIPVEWPAKAQATEFGAFRSCVSAGERHRRTGQKTTKSCSREQNEGNLLILVFFCFQSMIKVE